MFIICCVGVLALRHEGFNLLFCSFKAAREGGEMEGDRPWHRKEEEEEEENDHKRIRVFFLEELEAIPTSLETQQANFKRMRR